MEYSESQLSIEFVLNELKIAIYEIEESVVEWYECQTPNHNVVGSTRYNQNYLAKQREYLPKQKKTVVSAAKAVFQYKQI